MLRNGFQYTALKKQKIDYLNLRIYEEQVIYVIHFATFLKEKDKNEYTLKPIIFNYWLKFLPNLQSAERRLEDF